MWLGGSRLRMHQPAACSAAVPQGCHSCVVPTQHPCLATNPPLSLFLIFPGMWEKVSHTLGVRPSLSHAPSTCSGRRSSRQVSDVIIAAAFDWSLCLTGQLGGGCTARLAAACSCDLRPRVWTPFHRASWACAWRPAAVTGAACGHTQQPGTLRHWQAVTVWVTAGQALSRPCIPGTMLSPHPS